MIRPDRILHLIPVTRWKRDEVLSHLEATFDTAARLRPDMFEPYQIRLAGADDRERIAIMWQALRATFAARYPNRFSTEGTE